LVFKKTLGFYQHW